MFCPIFSVYFQAICKFSSGFFFKFFCLSLFALMLDKRSAHKTNKTIKMQNYKSSQTFFNSYQQLVHSSQESPKEDIKEQPNPRNLSATATRVLQCTCTVAASRKYFSAIHTSPHLIPNPHTLLCLQYNFTFTMSALYCCKCSE